MLFCLLWDYKARRLTFSYGAQDRRGRLASEPDGYFKATASTGLKGGPTLAGHAGHASCTALEGPPRVQSLEVRRPQSRCAVCGDAHLPLLLVWRGMTKYPSCKMLLIWKVRVSASYLSPQHQLCIWDFLAMHQCRGVFGTRAGSMAMTTAPCAVRDLR
jgi:hypothetical protein